MEAVKPALEVAAAPDAAEEPRYVLEELFGQTVKAAVEALGGAAGSRTLGDGSELLALGASPTRRLS
jgi:hypothetical protein